MRVLLLTSEYPPQVGGIASHVYELARALAPITDWLGVFVEAGNIPAHAPQRTPWAHADIHLSVVRFPASGKPFYDWLLKGWLVRFLRKHPVDIIHVHGIKPLSATRGLNIPVVFTNHSSGFLKRLGASKRRKQRTLNMLSHLAHIIAPSQELVDAAKTIGYQGPTSYIANGVDIAAFQRNPSARAQLRNQWQVEENTPVALLARRLAEKNGVRDFAHACALLKDTNIHFVIAGDGAERPAMESIIREAGLGIGTGERVQFLGAIPNQQMMDIYSAADLSVLPSYMEATSITGLESMACGLPLVGTKVGGIPDLIDEGVNGYLVDPRAPQQIADAVAKLASDPETCHSFGRAARARVEREFSWHKIAQDTYAVYQRIVHTPPQTDTNPT